jgi:hypothetical protein
MTRALTATDRIAAHKATPIVDSALSKLRTANLGYSVVAPGQYLVAGTVHFWPANGFWRVKGGMSFGYGAEKLIAAVLPPVQPCKPSLALVPPVGL